MADKEAGQKTVTFQERFSVGLKVALFFLICFLLLGEPFGLSLFLATLGGVATGWIVAGWKSKETQQRTPESIWLERLKLEKERFKKHKQPKQRQKRHSGWFFWKNPPSSK